MEKIFFKDNKFDSKHEAICSALFDKYGWTWERPKRAIGGWLPDFLLKGDTNVFVECKGVLEWDDVRNFQDLQKYEEAVSKTDNEVLLIPKSPKKLQNRNRYEFSALGYLFDGDLWSYAELGRWSGKVGFCHSANSWKDRMSGQSVSSSSGDGQRPDIEIDWRSATGEYEGKRVSFFKASTDSEVEVWDTSSR